MLEFCECGRGRLVTPRGCAVCTLLSAPRMRLSTRKCRGCKKLLPLDRYFKCHACQGGVFLSNNSGHDWVSGHNRRAQKEVHR